MTRRTLLIFATVFAGCGPRQRDLHAIPPENVAGGWVREEYRAMAHDDAPDIIRSMGVKQWLQASYRGTGRITVKIYELKNETSAFELMQKWRQDRELAFYKGPLFFTAVAASEEAKPALAEFTRAFEKAVSERV